MFREAHAERVRYFRLMTTSEVSASPFLPDVFAGQVAFVTGGATGHRQGDLPGARAATARRIAIASRKQEVLDRRRRGLAGEGIEVWTSTHATCGTRPRCGRWSRGSSARYGRLDVVVNNAAGNFPVPITNLSPNGFKAVVDIDLLGTYNVSKAAFDARLGEHGGNVVNITAPFELKGAAMQAHVAAAKAGVDSLTRTCAVEWGPYGIRVNAIAPGTIAGTEGVRRFAAAVPGASGDSVSVEGTPPRPRNPVGVVGHGADIAYMLLYLCSPAARFVSGQVIAVDGAGSVDQLKIDVSTFAGSAGSS